MSNVVKLTGFERVTVEQFQLEEMTGPWHFDVTVFEANYFETSQALQRLTPEQTAAYHNGDLNLLVVRVDALIDPTWLGSSSSSPVWVEGQTLSGGKIRTENGPAVDGVLMDNLKRRAIENGMTTLSDILGRLHIGAARDEVTRRAGIR